MVSEIRPAATVILLRDAADGLQTLILRRNSKLGFAAGMWVFPGGRIDDHEIEAADGDLDVAAKQAAVRETHEEAQLTVLAEDLLHYSHWTTPPHHPKRYSTWFFVARAPSSDDVVIDGSEIHDHQWISPKDALSAHKDGDVELMPPTFVALTEMAVCADVDEFLQRTTARNQANKAGVFEPHFAFAEKGSDKPHIALYAGDAGYEAFEPEAPGLRHRCVMSRDGWLYENDVLPW